MRKVPLISIINPFPSTPSHGLEMELHSLVRSGKSQRFVKRFGAGARFVGGELDHVTAFVPGPLNGPLKHLPAHPLRAVWPVNTHTFN